MDLLCPHADHVVFHTRTNLADARRWWRTSALGNCSKGLPAVGPVDGSKRQAAGLFGVGVQQRCLDRDRLRSGAPLTVDVGLVGECPQHRVRALYLRAGWKRSRRASICTLAPSLVNRPPAPGSNTGSWFPRPVATEGCISRPGPCTPRGCVPCRRGTPS